MLDGLLTIRRGSQAPARLDLFFNDPARALLLYRDDYMEIIVRGTPGSSGHRGVENFRVNISSRMNCGRESRAGGVIRDPEGSPATSPSRPHPRRPLIRGEFLTDLRENKTV